MMEKLQEVSLSTELEKPDITEGESSQGRLETPTIEDLKSKLEQILESKPDPEAASDKPYEPISDAEDSRTITLEDGTEIQLPDGKPKPNHMERRQESTSDAPTTENNPTRELTEDEKEYLKENLGWTDKQIAKCTIDEDGVIHYKTDREDMEGQTTENGIPYERKTIEIKGVKVEGVFPVFESACNVQLPEDMEQASNAKQFAECNEQLKEKIDNDPELRNSFTEEQLQDIEDGETPSGYVWHHNEEPGKMQLVKIEDHDKTQGGAAHTGGKALWGGGYSHHETENTNNFAQ